MASIALADEVRPVTVKPLAEVAVARWHDAPATAVALFQSTLSAELAARIDTVAVEVGDAVAAGARLVTLDCRETLGRARQQRESLKALEARLAFADYRVARARSLASREAVADEVLRQREAELATLRAERGAQQAVVDNAALQVSRCELRAPYTGVVIARQAQPGELAAPGTPLLTLVDVARVEVEATVRRERVADLRRAAAVVFVAGGPPLPVRLRTVLPSVDPRSDGQRLRLEFSAVRAAPGTPGRIAWQGTARTVAPELLERRSGRLGLFVLEGEATARFVALPEAQEGRPAEVDLPPSTRVIVDGRGGLADGDPVRPVR